MIVSLLYGNRRPQQSPGYVAFTPLRHKVLKVFSYSRCEGLDRELAHELVLAARAVTWAARLIRSHSWGRTRICFVGGLFREIGHHVLPFLFLNHVTNGVWLGQVQCNIDAVRVTKTA